MKEYDCFTLRILIDFCMQSALLQSQLQKSHSLTIKTLFISCVCYMWVCTVSSRFRFCAQAAGSVASLLLMSSQSGTSYYHLEMGKYVINMKCDYFVDFLVYTLSTPDLGSAILWQGLKQDQRLTQPITVKVSARVCLLLTFHWPSSAKGFGSIPSPCLQGQREVTCNEQGCLTFFFL